MSVTITLHLWWLGAYLAVGAVLWLPLEWLAYQQLHNPGMAFWRHLAWSLSKRPVISVPAMVVAWPLAVWEVLS